MMTDSREHSMTAARRGLRARLRRRAFTIVELLVAVAIIIVLLSLLIVAMSAAAKSGQKTRTQFLMGSIQQGMVQFHASIGYYPPVLGPSSTPIDRLRELYLPPVPGSATYVNDMQDYWSSCAIAEYLLGYGNHWQDGYGLVTGTTPAPDGLHDWDTESGGGIRHPGTDGVWDSTLSGTGSLCYRMGGNGSCNPNTGYNRGETNLVEMDKGKVYGPFLDLKDKDMVAAISGYDASNQPILHFPGDPLPSGVTWESLPKTLVDYWGVPIRYYRQPYPRGALSGTFRTGVDYNNNGNSYDDIIPSLADVFLLRPYSVKDGAAANGAADSTGDLTTTSELAAARFAIFSHGPDKRSNRNVRNDSLFDGDSDGKPDDLNRDNIVQVGP
jgi:type II secretory pathway pseudopilin PulG